MGLRGIDAKPLSERTLDPSRGNPWDAPGLTRAERVIAFLEDLTITSGPSAFTKLRVRPWQREFLEAIYAEKNSVRPVRTAVLSMGRKNGKTQLAAALALCHLSGPEAESRGEVYSCANDRFQAGRIFSEMTAMVQNHPWLSLVISTQAAIDKPTTDIHAAEAILSCMTLELVLLAASVVLGIVHIMIVAHLQSWQRGYWWTASSREQSVAPLTGVAGRAERALRNYLETFPFFAAAILVVAVTNTHSWLTVWGANFYFWGRIVYAILYMADLPLARSLVWNIPMVGILMNVAGLFLK